MKKIIQKSKKIIAVVSMCLICATTFAGEAVMLNADVNNSQKTESIVNFAANDIPVLYDHPLRYAQPDSRGA